MRGKILIVEDEASISEPLARLLTTEGYRVRVAASVAAARREVAAEAPSLVLLDWALPDGQGTELLGSFRQSGARFPVIMLTARSDLIDKVVGLELGADDYVTKPFEPRELLARIQARLRVAGDAGVRDLAGKAVRYGALELIPEAHTVTLGGRPVEVTRLEFALLRLLVETPGRVYTRDELLDKVWGFDATPTTRTVDTHVLQLRQKFGAELFETVRGVGYRAAVLKREDKP